MRMMKLKLSIRCVIICAVALMYFNALSAAELSPPLTQQSAAQLIAEQFGDKVLSTSVDKDKASLFRVKTLAEDGRVKIYYVDSITGQILK